MRDYRDIHRSSVEPVHSMGTGAKHQKPRCNYNQQHTAGGGGGTKRSCYRCGLTGHTPDKCHKNATCFNCRKVGHISNACQGNPCTTSQLTDHSKSCTVNDVKSSYPG